MSRTSLALNHARGFAIALVVSIHAVLAYLQHQPSQALDFARPPYAWRVVPIIDAQHWIGFDLFCALQFVVLMPFMFFLSGLFVWTSLSRRGSWAFLRSRLVRIGIPFIIGVYLLMPLGYYSAYRVGAVDPSWSAFWEQWKALPFWASGPLWFLWQILVLDLAAAVLLSLTGERLVRQARRAVGFPGRYFAAVAVMSVIAYVPFAAIFNPWDLDQIGPFAIFPSRMLHFIVFFFAGVVAGIGGIDDGLLRADGMLARRWAPWLGWTLVGWVAWMLLTALAMDSAPLGIGPVPHLDILANLVFALASVAGCFAFAALFLRFAVSRWPTAESLSDNAYGIYLIHYPFVVWLQYLLLRATLPAIAKGSIAFSGALLLSWGIASALRRTSIGALVIGAGRETKSSTDRRNRGGAITGPAPLRLPEPSVEPAEPAPPMAPAIRAAPAQAPRPSEMQEDRRAIGGQGPSSSRRGGRLS
jgi:glucans biosynthesis protein C